MIHSRQGRLLPAVVALAATTPWLASTAQAQSAELGLLSGDIQFSGVTPAVAAHLDANPIAAGGGTAVGCWRPGQIFTPAVQTAYTPADLAVSPTLRRVATYSANPAVEAGGSSFLVEVSPLRLGAATYIHGSRIPGDPAAHLCGPVLPATAQPAGLDCDVAECAAVARVRVKLEGENDDLDALTDPVGCAVTAAIGSATQAQTVAVLPLALLRGAGATVDLLVRAGASLNFAVACTSTPAAGEEGFALLPNGMASFAGATSAVTAACGALVDVAVDVPVERQAGDLRGLFDLSGLDESAAEIRLSPLNFAVSPPLFPAAAQPTRDDTASYWRFENLLAGTYDVTATAIVDSGNALVRLPVAGGPNGPAAVAAGGTTDLDATFVARPQPVEGTLVVTDVGAGTDLPLLATEPLTSLGLSLGSNGRTSRAELVGDPDLVTVPGGGSAFGGRAMGRLQGSYDAELDSGHYAYRTYLPGQSPLGADTDGREAAATAWDFDRYVLQIGQAPGHTQTIRVDPNRDFHVMAQPPGEDDGPLEAPEDTVCFGQIEVEMRVDPAEASIYDPRLTIAPASVTAPTTAIPNVGYTAAGNTRGLPAAQGDAAAQAMARATLPEGIQYPVTPELRFLLAGGGSPQNLSLPPQSIPAQGTLACGQRAGVCLQVLVEEEEATPLQVSLAPPLPFCQQGGGSLSTAVQVSSGGADVSAVVYQVDGGPQQVLCLGCGPDPGPLTIDLAAAAATAGPHTLRVEAGNADGCVGFVEQVFEVTTEPATADCGANTSITVFLDAGETALPSDDPRFTDALTVTALGGCGLPVVVNDDRPDVFPVGETVVHFWTADPEQACAVTVKVEPSRRQLAYIDGETVKVRRLEDGATQFEVAGLPRPHRLAYDTAGERLAIVHRDGVRVVDASSGADAVVFPGVYTSVAFRPTNNRHIAFVEAQGGLSISGPYQIRLLLEGAPVPLQVSAPLAMPSGWQMSAPEIAWSADGSRLLAIWDAASLTSAAQAQVRMAEWTVQNDTLTPGTQALWDTPRLLVKRVAYLGNSNVQRMLFTSRGVFRWGDTAVPVQTMSGTILAAGLEPGAFSGAGAYLGGLIAGSTGAAVGIVSEAGAFEGPTLEPKGGNAVAVSMPLRRVAAASPATQRIVLFEIQIAATGTPPIQLVEIDSWTAAPGPGLAFRPFAP